MTRLWKVTDESARACHGGTFDYTPYLPTLRKDGTYRPGKWLPRIADPVACERGYHGCRDQDLVYWLHGRIWAIEGRGVVVASDKVVMASCRFTSPTPWDDVAARLFAVECASEVRHLNTDPRVEGALEVATRHALGDATDAELDAAGAAAWAAARAAAWAAAWDAARDAARDAAWDAARDAARDAQTQRVLWWIGAERTR